MAVLKFKGKVLRNEFITPTVFEIDMQLDVENFTFEAGQFIMVKFKDVDNQEKILSRAYSILSAPEKKFVTLCVKYVEGGKGTTFLKALKINDFVDLSGPYGKFIYKTTKPRFPFFISTGTGIAPYVSIIESEKFQNNHPMRGVCLFGVRTDDEILYSYNFSKDQKFEFIPTVSQPSPSWKGFKGRVTHYLKELPQNYDWSLADYYICGGNDMIKEVKEILTSKGVPKDQIYQEIYFT
jgi:NAD(P)H-flavin reductase